MFVVSVLLHVPEIVQVGCMSRVASSASMASICAWIGVRAGESGRVGARLAASSRWVRSSSLAVRPAESYWRWAGWPMLARVSCSARTWANSS